MVWKSLSLHSSRSFDGQGPPLWHDRDSVSICHRLISVTVGWGTGRFCNRMFSDLLQSRNAAQCHKYNAALQVWNTLSQCALNSQRSTVSNRNLCALFSFSPLCTFKCHNVLETIAIYVLCSGLGMLLPEADWWEFSGCASWHNRSLPRSVNLANFLLMLPILPDLPQNCQIWQYCQFCTNVASIVKLAQYCQYWQFCTNIAKMINFAPMHCNVTNLAAHHTIGKYMLLLVTFP